MDDHFPIGPSARSDEAGVAFLTPWLTLGKGLSHGTCTILELCVRCMSFFPITTEGGIEIFVFLTLKRIKFRNPSGATILE